MNTEISSEIISYLIGIGLLISLLFILKNNNTLKQKKLFGFQIRNVVFALIIYFIVMIVLILLK